MFDLSQKNSARGCRLASAKDARVEMPQAPRGLGPTRGVLKSRDLTSQDLTMRHQIWTWIFQKN